MNNTTQHTPTFIKTGIVEIISILVNIFSSLEEFNKFWKPLLRREKKLGNPDPRIDPHLFHWNKDAILPIGKEIFKSNIYMPSKALNYTEIFEEAEKEQIKRIYQPQEACEITLIFILSGQMDKKDSELNVFYWDDKTVKKVRAARSGDGRLRIYLLDVDFNNKYYKCLAGKTQVAFG